MRAEQIACGADLGWCGASDAHVLLDETDRVVGTNTQYSDGTWVYPWLWAVYVEKTGDTKFLAARFSSPGPLGASAQPSIEATAQIIAADRTGPGGLRKAPAELLQALLAATANPDRRRSRR